MKKFFIMMVCALISLSAAAQSSPAAKARVAEIKKMYNAVKEKSAYKKEAELPPDEMIITNNYMAAGAGPIKETYHYYYSGDFNEDLGYDFFMVSFITRSYNVGDRQFYEELLFDSDGNLAFYYDKNSGGENRYYFLKGELVHKITQGEQVYDEVMLIHRYAAELVNSFSILLNRNW